MAKVKVVRQSGNPVDLEQAEAYDKEFKSRYDDLMAKHGQDMKAMHDSLIELDQELGQKYDTIAEFELPKSAKKWKELVDLYGSVLVSTHKDTGELMLVIMDLGI